MAEKKEPVPRVFISSTEEDLSEFRRAAAEGLSAAGCLPDMVEYWPASGHCPSKAHCLTQVDSADALVVIVAERYGWEPEDQTCPKAERKSITWLECEQAASTGKELLVFFVEAPDWPDVHREDHELRQKMLSGSASAELFALTQHKIARLNAFKGWLRGLGIRASVATTRDLSSQVRLAMNDWRKRHPDLGGGPPAGTAGPVTMHAEVHGRGVIAQGKGAVAAGRGGVAIGGDAKGNVIITGDSPKVTQNIHQEIDDKTDTASLERAYLNRLLEQAGYLSLSGFDPGMSRDKDARLRLEAVYTALVTTTARSHPDDFLRSKPKDRERDEHRSPFSALEMLDRERRLVLLGDPGSGKSTFVNFVALCLAGERTGNPQLDLGLLTHPLPDEYGDDREESQPWSHGPLLPVRVILRDFAAEGLPPVGEPATGDHLWRFIEASLGETLAEYRPLLRKQLLEQGGLILLDGLDEVPEAEHRRVQVKQAVDGFAQSFPTCRILLTSRTYAYQNQGWRLPGFGETTLAPLHDGQIRRFVRRWYEHAAALGRFAPDDAAGRAALLESAIFDRPQLRDLAERPLLLTLMASLHAWRGGTLPEQRERLYSDTVDLLLEFWEGRRVVFGPDRRPKVVQPSLAEYLKVGKGQVREVLEDLAFHAHAGQPDLEGTADIAEGDLLGRLLALSERSTEEPANTALLIHYLRDRAGILAARGVGVYTFPHRSFQEYLTACRLTGETFPDEIATLARQDPDRWREVALLAAAKAARGVRSSVWSLADCLCFREPDAPERSDADPWGARLAAEALAESVDLAKVGEANRTKLERVRRWLVHLLGLDTFPARARALIGHHLALLGDPRPEAMTIDAMQLCYVPPGPFRMGSGDRDRMAFDQEKPPHDQVIDYAYWLARYPITVAQFSAYVEAIGSQRGNPNTLRDDPNSPVRYLSWHEALAFCDWLTERWRDKGLLPGGYRVTLPSEPEWEKAARGGREIPAEPLVRPVAAAMQEIELVINPMPSRRYPWGDDPDPERANYWDSNVGDSSAVGAFASGIAPYGCEDMSGNLWEWTRSLWGEDWQDSKYKYPYDPSDGREDLKAPDSDRRVLRGGAFLDFEYNVRCAYRHYFDPDNRYNFLGFRVVLSPFL